MREMQFRQVPADLAAVKTRAVPIAHLNITATVIGSAQTLFTVRDGVSLEVKRLSVVNTTGTAATLSVHTVPSGGSAAVGNAEIFGASIPANTAADMTDVIQGLYPSGTTFEVYSGTNGALTIHGWGVENL